MTLSSNSVGIFGGALIVFAVAGCSGGSSQNPPQAPTSTVVGSAGGTASSSNGALKVAIPSGALPSSVTITVTPTASPGGGALGTVYALGPAGTTFAQPVTMTFSYQGVSLGGQSPSALRAATYVGGTWQLLQGYAQNAAALTVSGTTTSVGTFALWAPAATSSSSSGGPACASLDFGAVCGSSSGSSSGGSSTGGSSSGTTCTSPTCATGAAGACAGYPGSAQSCNDDVGGGFTVNCCFASGSPICFGMTGGVICSGGSSGGSGSGSSSSGGTCSPTTCAENAASMCAQYPGSSMTSCTDSSTGYQASCCYPVGQPICLPDTEAADCSGSSSSGSSSGAGSGSSSGGISCGPVPTCAGSSPSPCSAYAGTTVQACTDSATGYTATCCYPSGTLPPTDFAISGGSSSGSSSGGTLSGSSTGGSSSGG